MGCTQTFVTVGGITEVVVDAALDVVEVMIVVGVQGATVGVLGPLGGFWARQLLLLQLLPVQVLQYKPTFPHQLANSKHWRASGNELEKKQSATWSRQEDAALPHDALSLKRGKGLEHHFPTAYSQVGAGATDVQGVAFVTEVLNVVSDADEVMILDVILLLDVEPGVEVVVESITVLLEALCELVLNEETAGGVV